MVNIDLYTHLSESQCLELLICPYIGVLSALQIPSFTGNDDNRQDTTKLLFKEHKMPNFELMQEWILSDNVENSKIQWLLIQMRYYIFSMFLINNSKEEEKA